MRSLLSLLAAVFFATAASAETLKVDKDRSSFGIDVKASPPHSFTVDVTDYVADIKIDSDGEVVSASVSFNFLDLDSDSNGRDKKMRKWMDVEEHPQVRFVLDEVRREGALRIGIGKVWMHGVSQAVEVPFSLGVRNGQAALAGSATIDYQNWGLEIISIFFFKVKPELEIHFSLVGSVE